MDETAWNRELQQLRQENEQLKRSCEDFQIRLDNYIHEGFLVDLLGNNRISETEYRQNIEAYQIPFSTDRFAVMCISVDTEFSVLFDEEPIDQEGLRYTRFLIRNILEELMGRKNYCRVITIQGELVALLNLREPSDLALSSISTCAHQATQLLEEHYDALVRFSISRAHEGFQELPAAYQEALSLVQYRVMTGDEIRVMEYDNHTEQTLTKERIEHFDFEHKLGSCIRAGDYEAAREIVHTMLNAEFGHTRPTVQVFMVRAYGIINDILHVFDSLEESFTPEFLVELQAGPRIVNATSLSEISRELDSIFDAIIEKQQGQETEPAWVQKAIDYMDRNFADQNLNVANVAETVGINPVYMSRMLKKYRNIRPLDYIHQRRIEKAKALLSSGVTVKDTLPQVGYSSALTMNRAFRKFENTTPGAFFREG